MKKSTHKRLVAWLLTLALVVMLLSLLPTTALAAGNYPEHVRLYNKNGISTSLSDGECLVTNDGKATSYSGGAYVARYDSGTLYLNGYHGVVTDGKIFADGDLNIKVESDSSFTTSTTAAGNLYGIRADGGTLNIFGTGKLTVTANGRGNVYGISAKEGVTISAPLAVKVGKNSPTENGPVYGIHAQSGTISLSGNDMTVTATGGTENAYGVYNEAQTSSSAADSSNITISGNLTVNLSNGKQNRGISSQGGDITLNGATVKIPGSYYYGIFNDNGNVVIKSNSDVDISSDISSNNGICTDTGGDLTIENSTVKVSANGHAANLKGNVSIKDSTVELTLTANYYEVIRTGNSSAANTIDLSGNGSVTLTASGNQEYAMITGKVTITPGTKLEKGKKDGSSYDGEYDAANKITVLQFVHESTTPTTNISVSGTITSYGDASEAVTVTLTKQGETAPAFTDTLTVASGSAPYSQNYSFPAVPAGTYTLKVEKKGHAPWTENITVGSADVTKDVTIYLIGDVNGDGAISVSDMQRLYAHLNGTKPLTDTSTADVNNDKVISVSDMQRLYAHISGKNPLS